MITLVLRETENIKKHAHWFADFKKEQAGLGVLRKN
jgi:hypothetical protein